MRLNRCRTALALIALASGPVLAEKEIGERETRVEEMSLNQLEEAFWACDHAATVAGVFGTAAFFCGAVNEELKKQKFGGDFDRMLSWWRLNKAAEYEKLERK